MSDLTHIVITHLDPKAIPTLKAVLNVITKAGKTPTVILSNPGLRLLQSVFGEGACDESSGEGRVQVWACCCLRVLCVGVTQTFCNTLVHTAVSPVRHCSVRQCVTCVSLPLQCTCAPACACAPVCHFSIPASALTASGESSLPQLLWRVSRREARGRTPAVCGNLQRGAQQHELDFGPRLHAAADANTHASVA